MSSLKNSCKTQTSLQTFHQNDLEIPSNDHLLIHKDSLSEQHANFLGIKVHNWVRPTFEQLQKLNDGSIEHVLNGGLMLEDELSADGIGNEEIKKTERMAQKLLEQLQGTDASFLFVGDEGNCFTIGGDPEKIISQILFAMSRYPIVESIIKKCAKLFDNMPQDLRKEIKNLKMEHQIEENSGN